MITKLQSSVRIYRKLTSHETLESVHFDPSVPPIVSKHHGETSENKGVFVQEDHGGRKTASWYDLNWCFTYNPLIFSLWGNWCDGILHMAIFDINSKVHIQQLFLSLVELCSFCVSVLSQSKKNYELRCKEADEAEQGAEKTTSKNPDKVQQVNELPHSKNMSELLVVWRGSDTNVQGILFRPSSLHLTTPPNDHRFSSVHELQVSSW